MTLGLEYRSWPRYRNPFRPSIKIADILTDGKHATKSLWMMTVMGLTSYMSHKSDIFNLLHRTLWHHRPYIHLVCPPVQLAQLLHMRCFTSICLYTPHMQLPWTIPQVPIVSLYHTRSMYICVYPCVCVLCQTSVVLVFGWFHPWGGKVFQNYIVHHHLVYRVCI